MEAGVAIAVGSDRYSDTAAAEAIALDSLKVFSSVELLNVVRDRCVHDIPNAKDWSDAGRLRSELSGLGQ